MVDLNDIVMDTIGLVHYLEDDLPRSAAAAVERVELGEGTILLPQIALAEFTYIALKGRLRLSNSFSAVEQIIDQIKSSQFISISSMPVDAWAPFVHLAIPELHDRMIAVEALVRKIPLISNDPSFETVKGLKVIWR